MEKVWSVILTYHADDYKSRGESWTNSTTPKLFKYKERAEQELCDLLYERIHEKLTDDYERCLKILGKEGLDDLITGDDDDETEFFIDESLLYDLPLVSKLTKELTKGDYVSETLTWDIEECCLDTHLHKLVGQN